MNIEVTDNAITKLIEKTSIQNDKGVRIGITGGGCGGYEYIFDYIENRPAQPDDHIIDYGKFSFYIDPESVPYLDGLVLDHRTEGMNEEFRFENPNVETTCGCGVSMTF